MLFSPVEYVLLAAVFILQLTCFAKLRDPQFRAIRYLMLFAAVRDVVVLFASRSVLWYFQSYWTLQMVELVWFAWIAGGFAMRHRIAARIPAASAAICCLYVIIRFRWPWLATGAEMLSFQAWMLALCVASLMAGIVLQSTADQLKLALAVMALMASGLIGTGLLVVLGNLQETWSLAWGVGLYAVLRAASMSAPRAGNPVFQNLAL